jgi:hypothetical protein
MRVKLILLMIPVLILLSITFTGCKSGTDLTVDAPPGVDVKSATLNDNGTLNCMFTANRSGTLEFTLDYQATITSKHNPNILIGSINVSQVLSFSIDVEDGQEYNISRQLQLGVRGDMTRGTLLLRFKSTYYIDYENGTIPIGDLPIGARVVDPSWEWAFRTGDDYTGSGEIKPVVWIIVAKDHYVGLEPHVTLLAEELIGRFVFDDSTSRGSKYGSSHWGECGTANATRGLRPWLNSSGIHSGNGFYRAFSESFTSAVLTTTVPNKEWQSGSAYSTQDYVFTPSTTELGDSAHENTYQIGTAYAYFTGAGDTKRVALLDGETWYSYWTRSPGSSIVARFVRGVSGTGEFDYNNTADDSLAVRPALNLKSGVLVSEIKY